MPRISLSRSSPEFFLAFSFFTSMCFSFFFASSRKRFFFCRSPAILTGRFNGRMARANRVQVSVTYYEACKDVNHEAYGSQGQYKTITGICWNVDAEVTKTILVDKMRIPMGDIVKVEAPGEIFETRWEDQSAD